MSSPHKTAVWIASYPKSGNTWVRFLVCNLVFGPVDSAAALSQMAPDIHETSGVPELPAGRLVFMKTHFPYSADLPLASQTAAAIYVVREPADVMLSNFHYSRRRGVEAGNDSAALDRYVDTYIASRGDPRWIELGMGTWEENVRSWVGMHHDFPVLCIRYEDLLADGLKLASTVCQFLRVTRTPEEIATALAGASFERMRDIEEADIRGQRVGIFYKPYLQQSINTGVRFMRAGRCGEASQVLSDDQLRRLDAVFGSLRERLGYSRRAQ